MTEIRKRKNHKAPQRRWLPLLVAVLSLTIKLPLCPSAGPPQNARPGELLRVLSRTRFSPPLRGPATQVRFSPDGHFLFVQFDSGIFVLTREPLAVQSWIYAPGILTPRFAKAAQTLILATQNLEIARWSLVGNRQIERRAMNPADGCVISDLSQDGSLAACLDPNLVLRVYETTTGKQIVAESAKHLIPAFSAALVQRSESTAYSHMIGYAIADSMRALGSQDLFGWRLEFSPNGRYVLLLSRGQKALAIDLIARKTIRLPSTIEKHPDAPMCFVSENKLVIFEPERAGAGRIIEFPSGLVVQNFMFAATSVEAATQEEYLLLSTITPEGRREVRVLEPDTGKIVKTALDTTLDVWNDLLAVYTDDGAMQLIQFSENETRASTMLPAPALPQLRAAGVSQDLGEITLAIRDAGGVFQTDTGRRMETFARMTGVWFANDSELYAETLGGDEFILQDVNVKSGTVAESWKAKLRSRPASTIIDVQSSGPVILFHQQSNVGKPLDNQSMIYTLPGRVDERKLWARDMKSGQELWSRTWSGDPPVPYADPQGERVLLGWRASTSGGQALAKRYPELRRQLNSTNLSVNHAVFEVLDVRTGEALGTVLVHDAWGPESFVQAFSVGDSVIFERDVARVTVYSLSTGKITAKIYGRYVSASGSANLLAALDGNRLRLFDLNGGSKRDEYLFSDAPVYTHFSKEGKRLLVLTEQQFVYVLDIADIAAAGTGTHKSKNVTSFFDLSRECTRNPGELPSAW